MGYHYKRRGYEYRMLISKLHLEEWKEKNNFKIWNAKFEIVAKQTLEKFDYVERKYETTETMR